MRWGKKNTRAHMKAREKFKKTTSPGAFIASGRTVSSVEGGPADCSRRCDSPLRFFALNFQSIFAYNAPFPGCPTNHTRQTAKSCRYSLDYIIPGTTRYIIPVARIQPQALFSLSSYCQLYPTRCALVLHRRHNQR